MVKFVVKINQAGLNEVNRRRQRALFAAGKHLENQLTKNLMQGTRSGRTYRIPGTTITYTASKPGEFPALRTGALSRSYELTPPLPNAIQTRVTLGTRLHYAPILERKLNRRHLGRTFDNEERTMVNIITRIMQRGRDS